MPRACTAVSDSPSTITARTTIIAPLDDAIGLTMAMGPSSSAL